MELLRSGKNLCCVRSVACASWTLPETHCVWDPQWCDPGEAWQGPLQAKSTWHSQETHAGIVEGLCFFEVVQQQLLETGARDRSESQRVRTLGVGQRAHKWKREGSSHLCTSHPSQAQTGVCHRESRGVLVEEIGTKPRVTGEPVLKDLAPQWLPGGELRRGEFTNRGG